MRALDLFCGFGGWSDGFAAMGFDVTGVDIDRSIARIYPFDFILADVRNLNGSKMLSHFDVIVSSPPCTEFSTARRRTAKPDMSCVDAVRRIVDQAKPSYWIMENVRGALRYLGPAKVRHFPFYFWGHFPPFQFERANTHRKLRSRDPNLRGMIPLYIANAFAEACKRELSCSQ